MKLFKSVKAWYEKKDSSSQENILFIFNYVLNSIPISIFIYLLMSLKLNHGMFRFLGTYTCTVIFLVYFEHYYVWIRSEWNKK
jgi:uncharacterized membrane-anchored protein YitT (DUF2179 family)